MARAFVAVVPPAEVLEAVAPVAAQVGSSAGRASRPTKRAQWHVTLRFFDDVDEQAAALSLEGLELESARVGLGGFGAFPTERKARVVWLGATEGARWLATAASHVERLTAHLVAEQPREFHPHLTLVRLRAPRDLRSDLVRWRRAWPDTVGAWTARELVLVRSVLTDAGARHETVSRFSLG